MNIYSTLRWPAGDREPGGALRSLLCCDGLCVPCGVWEKVMTDVPRASCLRCRKTCSRALKIYLPQGSNRPGIRLLFRKFHVQTVLCGDVWSLGL